VAEVAETDRLGIQLAFAVEALRAGGPADDALVALVRQRAIDNGGDDNMRRILKLKLVAACVAPDILQLKLNVGQQSDTVDSMDVKGRVHAELRRMAKRLLWSVAALLKGGQPDPIGVLKLALGTDRAPAADVLKVAFRSRAWSIQLLSIVSSTMPTRHLLDFFSNLGHDATDGHVFEITRHDIQQARARCHWPGMPISVIEHHRPGCRNPERIAVANRFIEQHRTQVKASKAACTTRLTPLVYVLTGNYLELFAKYLVSHLLFDN
jgi:hypothetical protein